MAYQDMFFVGGFNATATKIVGYCITGKKIIAAYLYVVSVYINPLALAQ